jgi:hypothetical protein
VLFRSKAVHWLFDTLLHLFKANSFHFAIFVMLTASKATAS